MQIKKLNHGIEEDTIVAGEVLLLPTGHFSTRDTQIMQGIFQGIGHAGVRVYPVRQGETITDIIVKRGIHIDEVEALNPDVDLEHLSGGQTIHLPAGKFTQREKEVLQGIAPAELLSQRPPLANMASVVFTVSPLILIVAVLIARLRGGRSDS
eukprot:scaffold2799_cov408-Prasinococcus_capsulatus_cf.AAC.10